MGGFPMARSKRGHERGLPPGAPLPEGLFLRKSGPPTPHPLTAEIRERGPEWLYCHCQEQGLNAQSTYSYLRSFFRLNFKEFKALARRVEHAERVAPADRPRE
jgi:hypothetical protein